MKAAVVCANEDVQYLDYEEPTPGPGEVKVKVKCSGICGSDIPRVLHNGVHFYPIVLGHEFSGDVVEVGEGVTKVKVGDHVSGALSERKLLSVQTLQLYWFQRAGIQCRLCSDPRAKCSCI